MVSKLIVISKGQPINRLIATVALLGTDVAH